MWSDRRILDLLGIEHPIIQAPMAGCQSAELAIAVSEAGGLGSLPCALLGFDQVRAEMDIFRQRTAKPLNVNFFCHGPPAPDAAREAAWRKRLGAYYAEFGIDPAAIPAGPGRAPFDEKLCELMLEKKPAVLSFHFGLPGKKLLERARSCGAKILSSATTVEEARWLEGEGCDAVIAQGNEAGGHRGIFLSDDIASQPGTFALVPQVADAVKVPVIAAGGIADARGVAAALMLGASAAQVGTAYLLCPEAGTSAVHRAALKSARDDRTVLTNLFTGRPARGLLNRIMREAGPMNADAPKFPLATGAIAPLRAKAEAKGSGDFSPLWAGQAAALACEMPAGELTRKLAAGAAERLRALGR
ncbi:MAG: NAD(P)H-dependent flavin oxidoreductase [Rhodospirillales bacterium]